MWRVLQTDAVRTLASVVKGVAWSLGEALVAECLGPRLIPLPRLGRAANAASNATDLAHASRYLRDSIPFDLGRVLGRVALWGTVVECERGFRLRMRTRSRCTSRSGAENGSAQRALELAEGLSRYGVPVELLPREQPDLAPAA